MSENVILDDFFEFDIHFSRYIEKSIFFLRIKNAQFIIFDPEYSRILYKYNYFGSQELDFKEISFLNKEAKIFERNRNVEYCTISHIDERKYDYIIKVYNNVLQDVLVASVFISLNEPLDISILKKELDSYYLDDLCNHIQMAIANYDKLYYLVDVYTELLMAKDKFMPYHMSNVANWCVKLCNELGTTDKENIILYISALLHDVGKLFISDEIINKTGKLTVEEYNLVKHHSEKGAQVIRASLYGMSLLNEVPTIIRHHHEHFDGSGYPDSLMGENIPYLSRILAVADTVDAMLSRRSYKEPYTYDEIIAELSKYSGTQFDPQITNAMVRVIDNYIDTIQSTSFVETKFIAQASLTFYYKDFSQIVTCNGNLVIKRDNGHFLVHESSQVIKDLDIEHIYKSTISFFSMKDFVEYKVSIDSVLEGKFYLNLLTFLPTDKLFSMVWNGTILVRNFEGNIKEFEMIKLGGDSVVIQIPLENASFFLVEPMQQLSVIIEEEIDELNVSIDVGVRMLKYYKTNMGFVFVFKYLELPPGERDKLIRLLFRKQMMMKKSKKETLKKINRGS